MNTMETQERLVSRGLATKSVNGHFVTYKYARKVMFQNLWTPELMECRGHTYDIRNGNIVTLPFPKFFAYGENGTWKDAPLSETVLAYKKINGYMAAAAMYDGELVVSTTGSTKSEYAQWAREAIKDVHIAPDVTALFEICVPQDPHIVPESYGAHLLAVRDKAGELQMGLPASTFTLGEAVEFCKTYKGEGLMLEKADGSICKLKSDYYAGKKLLMRRKKIPDNLPGAWGQKGTALYDTAQKVREYAAFGEKSSQERRQFIEELEHQNE